MINVVLGVGLVIRYCYCVLLGVVVSWFRIGVWVRYWDR